MYIINRTSINTDYLRALAIQVFKLIRKTEGSFSEALRKEIKIEVEYSHKNIFHGKAFRDFTLIKIFVPMNANGDAIIPHIMHHEIMHLLGYDHGDRYRGTTWHSCFTLRGFRRKFWQKIDCIARFNALSVSLKKAAAIFKHGIPGVNS